MIYIIAVLWVLKTVAQFGKFGTVICKAVGDSLYKTAIVPHLLGTVHARTKLYIAVVDVLKLSERAQ